MLVLIVDHEDAMRRAPARALEGPGHEPVGAAARLLGIDPSSLRRRRKRCAL